MQASSIPLRPERPLIAFANGTFPPRRDIRPSSKPFSYSTHFVA